MNFLMGLALKYLGLGKLWDAVDGYKTAIAGFSGLLHALAALILFAAGLVDQASPLLQAHDLNGLVHLAQGLQHIGADPNVAAFSAAWSKFYTALGIVGIGHKIDKAAADPAPSGQLP